MTTSTTTMMMTRADRRYAIEAVDFVQELFEIEEMELKIDRTEKPGNTDYWLR